MARKSSLRVIEDAPPLDHPTATYAMRPSAKETASTILEGAFDFSGCNFVELLGICAAVTAEIDRRRDAEIAGLRNEVAARAAQLGVEVALIFGAPPSNRKKGAKPARFRDDVSGQTWSGHGPRPGWLRAHLLSGRKLDEFRTL